MGDGEWGNRRCRCAVSEYNRHLLFSTLAVQVQLDAGTAVMDSVGFEADEDGSLSMEDHKDDARHYAGLMSKALPPGRAYFINPVATFAHQTEARAMPNSRTALCAVCSPSMRQ